MKKNKLLMNAFIIGITSGLIGIGIATTFFVISLVSTSSYTKTFTYPVAPLNFTEIKKNLFSRISISEDDKRQKILTNNLTKSRR